ncbi:hypothetical protein BGY98DRAFT_1095878 [Russula aff. rugulosa BPL654]|nr:hypothetical protein BGY98DRAFT_1095878 [Russula aff. rugulosa BPL654]
MSPSLQNTNGTALLAAAMFCAAFSGVLAVQIFFYHHKYPNDHRLYKVVVAWFWLIDTMQTTSIAVAAWSYLIRHNGDPETPTEISTPYSIAVYCTRRVLICQQAFFLTQNSTDPINRTDSKASEYTSVVLSVIRFGLSTGKGHSRFANVLLTWGGTVTVIISELFMAKSLVNFSERYKPLVDVAFSLAAVADIYIACVLCYFLKDSRRDAPLGTKRMLDMLVIMTINNGALTSVFSIATFILWLTMQTNAIFLAVLFMTGKCYSNSQMATFNMRKWIHDRSIVATVVSDPDSSFHMSNRNSVGRTGLRRTSGGVTITAVVDQVKDGYAKRPPSPTTTDEAEAQNANMFSRVN